MNGSVAYLVAAAGCLVGVAGVVIVLVALRRARRQADQSRPQRGNPAGPVDPFRDHDADVLRGDPRRLRPGDIVEIRQTSYGVRGTLRFTEGSYSWAEHLLDDANGAKIWLSVEEDPDLELAFWTAVPTATVTPGPPTVDFDGRRYASEESGRARYSAIGTTGLDPTGTVHYHDYAAKDDALLSFEAYGDGGKWEVARGERLHRAEVTIYPQAGQPDQAG